MAIDIEKFRASLEARSMTARFKITYSKEDTALMLEEVYKFKVAERQMEYKPADIVPTIAKVAWWITEGIKPGLLLYGTIGSGKTTMADSILTTINTLHPKIRLYRRSAINIASLAQNDRDRFDDVMRAEMLLIDDLGEEPVMVKNYGNEISPLVQILYHRYDHRLFTIITTNKTMEEIREIYGARIEDRFAEVFDRLYFKRASYRQDKDKKEQKK